MKVIIFSFALLALLAVAFAVLECPDEEGEFATLMGNPDDCSTFYKCSFGAPVLYNCSEGLEWNAELQTCDWAENANCTTEVSTDNE